MSGTMKKGDKLLCINGDWLNPGEIYTFESSNSDGIFIEGDPLACDARWFIPMTDEFAMDQWLGKWRAVEKLIETHKCKAAMDYFRDCLTRVEEVGGVMTFEHGGYNMAVSKDV